MNFPEDLPNYSQSFMSFVDQVYCFFKTCTYSLFIYTLSIKLFVPSATSIFPNFFCNLNSILNIQAATPNSSLLVCTLIFPAFLFLGEKQNWSFDSCTNKTLIIVTLTRNDTNIKFSISIREPKNNQFVNQQEFYSNIKTSRYCTI